MKAFVVDRYGRKQSLRFVEMPNPELREDDVLVRVHAAGVKPSGFEDQGWRVQAHLAAHPRK